jgi:hypothetical protein
MVYSKQERGDKMNAKTIDTDDDLIPRDDPIYAGMQDETIDAYRSLARSWTNYERSNAWHIRICRKLGIHWATMLGLKLRVSRFKTHVKYAIHDVFFAMDRLVDRFNNWMLRR